MLTDTQLSIELEVKEPGEGITNVMRSLLE